MWVAGDEALLAGMATDDPDATSAFVRRFERRVFGLALTMLGGEVADAEDLAQEVFVRAWRHAGTYDARRGSVLNWLLTITRNLAIDVIRVRRARDVQIGLPVALQIVSVEPRPDEAVVVNDENARVRAAIDTLPWEQRRALVLAAFFGRTALEISESEAIPLGTAKTRIRLAMRRLRQVLSEDGERGA